MRTLAGAGDTWGISGPDFLAVYAATLAVLLLLAILWRVRAVRSGDADGLNSPTPGQIAMMQGGPARAGYASLAALRAAGVVGVNPTGDLAVTAAAPAGLSRLDHAVYQVAARQVPAAEVPDDPGVRSALDEITESLVRTGWVPDAPARARARLGAWLVLALAGLGLIRLLAGTANGHPVGYLLLLLALTAVTGLVLLRVPGLTTAGRASIARVRAANLHLAPNQSPAWSTYGMTGAAMGVALFGTSALWAADPVFAAEAGIRREAVANGGGSDSGGSDSGGGSGCGGGCGGGGCGG